MVVAAVVVVMGTSVYIKVSVRMYVRSYVRNGGRDQLSSEWCHNQNDVIMRIAGLWRYGEWQHVATYWLQVQSPNHRITTHVCHFNTSKPSVWLPVVHEAIQWHIHKIKKWSHIFPWCIFVYVWHGLSPSSSHQGAEHPPEVWQLLSFLCQDSAAMFRAILALSSDPFQVPTFAHRQYHG